MVSQLLRKPQAPASRTRTFTTCRQTRPAILLPLPFNTTTPLTVSDKALPDTSAVIAYCAETGLRRNHTIDERNLADTAWKPRDHRASHIAVVARLFSRRALSERRRDQAFGIAMGLGAICSMMLAVPLDQGVLVDLRYTLVAVSALFGGPFSVLLTIVIASAFRLSEGGAGALDGVISICVVGMVGLCGYLVVRKRKVRLADAAVLGIAVSTTLLVVMSVLTSQANARAVELVGFPITVLNFLSIMIAAFVLIQFERTVHDRDILLAALTQTPDFHYVKNREGKLVIVNKNVAEHHHYRSPAAMVGASDFQLATQRRAEMLYAK